MTAQCDEAPVLLVSADGSDPRMRRSTSSHFGSDTAFAVLQSRVHERWARLLSSSMEDPTSLHRERLFRDVSLSSARPAGRPDSARRHRGAALSGPCRADGRHGFGAYQDLQCVEGSDGERRAHRRAAAVAHRDGSRGAGGLRRADGRQDLARHRSPGLHRTPNPRRKVPPPILRRPNPRPPLRPKRTTSNR